MVTEKQRDGKKTREKQRQKQKHKRQTSLLCRASASDQLEEKGGEDGSARETKPKSTREVPCLHCTITTAHRYTVSRVQIDTPEDENPEGA